jgi:hypothetical protein
LGFSINGSLLQNTVSFLGLFSAKETCNFKEPTHRSHPGLLHKLKRSVGKATETGRDICDGAGELKEGAGN